MPRKRKTDTVMLAHLHRQMQRPGQGPADGPYWIVMNLSRHKQLWYSAPSFPFRHPTEESAQKEAERLAAEADHIGWRFGVFAYTGISAKVEATPVPIEIGQELEKQAA